MTIQLPPTSHPAREALGDMHQVVDALHPERRQSLPTLRQALIAAQAYFAAEPKAKALHVICWKADGSLVLERIGSKGAHRSAWVFSR